MGLTEELSKSLRYWITETDICRATRSDKEGSEFPTGTSMPHLLTACKSHSFYQETLDMTAKNAVGFKNTKR